MASSVLPAGKRALAGFRDDIADKVVSGVEERIDTARWSERINIWIFFRDHGEGADRIAGTGNQESLFTSRTARRIELRSSKRDYILDYTPVYSGYIEQLKSHIISIRNISKYFNAVSVELSEGELEDVSSLPFVKSVALVKVYRRKPELIGPGHQLEPVKPTEAGSEDSLLEKYGASFEQLALTESLDLLEEGYNGSGRITGNQPVMICILDTGFNLTHEAFSRVNIIEQFDFVQSDPVTSDQPGDYPGQAKHGTTVLGTIAGYKEGNLIGPAWGADYILAKTEILGEEIRIEEDNWVAGIEWADSIGADIVTSSLGYIDWYTPDSLDGKTCLCTIAADIAVAHGMVVVNSVGNYGYLGETSLIAPADGFGVIAVGSVDRYGDIAYSSSHGPTADGRIKPDLVARGVNVHSVSYQDRDEYSSYNGTSFAAPLIAGLCAQLLEIHPGWNPATLRDSLTATSSRNDDPDNTYGYGIPHAYAAAGFVTLPVSSSLSFGPARPNPFQELVSFNLSLPVWEIVDIRVYDCAGRLVRVLLDSEYARYREVVWDGKDNNGCDVTSGVYFIRCLSESAAATGKIIRIR